MLLKRVR